MGNRSFVERVIIKLRYEDQKEMKGKLIPEKGNSNWRILSTGMSLVDEVGGADRNRKMAGFRVKIQRSMLFLVPQGNLDL